MSQFQLVVFDMAGTTVADHGEVKAIFLQAARNTGLPMTPERLQPLRGLSKRVVFRQLWGHELGPDAVEIQKQTNQLTAEEEERMLGKFFRRQTVFPGESHSSVFYVGYPEILPSEMIFNVVVGSESYRFSFLVKDYWR